MRYNKVRKSLEELHSHEQDYKEVMKSSLKRAREAKTERYNLRKPLKQVKQEGQRKPPESSDSETDLIVGIDLVDLTNLKFKFFHSTKTFLISLSFKRH